MHHLQLKGDQATTRALNTRMILDILRRDDTLSRRDLALITGLSSGAVTALVQELIDQGIVVEGEAGKSSGGRRPIPIKIAYDARWSIGIKLREGGIEGVLANLASQPIKTLTLDLDATSPEAVAKGVATLVRRLIRSKADREAKLIGVGLAMPGFIDVHRGVVLSSHRLGWVDVPVSSLVAAEIGVPVWVENDANAYAIAQRLFGLARDCQSVLTVILGTGIGAAVITNGRIHRGRGYRAGEIGFHKPVSEAGREDLSALYSLDSLATRWRARTATGMSLSEAGAQGLPEAVAFLREEGADVGHRLALLVQLMDPDLVIVGGETLALGDAYCDAIADAIRDGTLAPHCDVAFDRDNDIWTRAAAVLAIDHFFDFESASGHLRPDSVPA